MGRRLLQACCGLCALLLLAGLVGCGSPESRARRHHEKGLLYAKNYRPKEAVEHFKKAISLDPQRHETHYELARVYFSQKLLGDAEKQYRKAIEIKPDYVKAYIGLAEALHSGENVEEAITVCEDALQKDPDSGEVRGFLGDIYRGQGETEKAIAEYGKALEKEPGLVKIRGALGRTLFSAGKVDEAREVALTTVDKFDSGNFDAHMLLSGILEREKEYDKAIEEAKTALEKNKGRASAHLTLAFLYLRTSQFDEAFKQAQQAMRSRATEAGAMFVRGSVQFQREKFSEAVVDLQSALRGRPDWAEAHYRLARALYRNNQPGMAAAEYETLLQQLPEFDEARLRLAFIALEQGWFSQAESNCKKVLDRNPTERRALRCLARVYDVQGKSEDAALIRARLTAVASSQEKTELQVAVEALARGDADGAIETCRTALENTPDDVGLLNVLGLAYIKKGELEEAANQFRQAIEADPESVSPYLNLSTVFLMQKKYDEAAQQCQLALLKSPKSSAPHYRLGTIYRLQENYGDALKAFRAAAGANPKDISAHNAVVEILLMQKKPKDALAYCQEVISRFPKMASAYELAARVHLAMGEPDNAAAELEKAVEKDKSLLSARVRLAKVYLGQKKVAESRKESGQLLRLMGDMDTDSAFIELAPLYEQGGDFESDAADVQSVLSEKEDNVLARLILAQLYCREGQLEQAVSEVQDILASGKEFASAHHILGWVRAREGDRSESTIEFRKALSLRPDWLDARMKLSDVLKADGRYQEAIEELEAVLERRRDHLPALVSIAASELQAGLLDAAERHSSEAADLDPTNVMALRLLHDTLVIQGDSQGAQDVYARIQKVSPSAASAPAFVAAAQLRSAKPDEAIATCQEAIASGNKDARVYGILGLAQLSKKLYSEAISSLQESVSLDPEFLPSRINLAEAYNAAGKTDLAAEELRTVLSRSPKAAWFRARLAAILASQKKYSEATKEFETALKDSNNNSRIAALAGQNHLLLKDYQKAREMYEIVVASIRDQNILASAYNNLAWIGCMEERDLRQALSLATKANEYRPDDPSILDTTGWILYKLERYGEAGEKLTSAVVKNPDNALIRYHLGMALVKDGQKDQALNQLKRALSLDSTFDEADEARRVIAEIEKKD